MCFQKPNFFTDSWHEPHHGKITYAREWKLFAFPIEENIFEQILTNPNSTPEIPMASILARWQLPIQVLVETRDPTKLKKNKRKHSPVDDWPMLHGKKPKISLKKQSLINRIIALDCEEKIEQLEAILTS